jgi:hypothetical protein
MQEKHGKRLRAIRADLYTIAAELARDEGTEELSQEVRQIADAVPVVATLVKTRITGRIDHTEGDGMEHLECA